MDQREFSKTWLLPLGLLGGVLAGLLFPAPGAALAGLRLAALAPSDLLVGLVFLLSGLQLKLEELKGPGRFKRTLLLGLVINLLLAPLLYFMLPMPEDAGLRLGMAVMLCAPTTLSSGIVVNESAGGNRSLAVALTLFLTLAGVPLLPFSLSWLLEAEAWGFSTSALLLKMALLSLLPLGLGVAIRRLRGRGLPGLLSPAASACVILTVWMSVSASQGRLAGAPLAMLGWALGLGIASHTLLLLLSLGGARLLGLAYPERAAFLFITAQKTVVLGVAVLLALPASVTDGALAGATVTGVAFHYAQIVMDSFLALKLRHGNQLKS